MGLRLPRLRVSTDPLPSPPVPSRPARPPGRRPHLPPARAASSPRAPPSSPSAPRASLCGRRLVHGEDKSPASRASSAREAPAEAGLPLPPAARRSAGDGKSAQISVGGDGRGRLGSADRKGRRRARRGAHARLSPRRLRQPGCAGRYAEDCAALPQRPPRRPRS